MMLWRMIFTSLHVGGKIDIGGPLKKLRKKRGKLISIFWDLEKIAVNPAPLCTVPEVKDKKFKSKKGYIKKISTKLHFLDHK